MVLDLGTNQFKIQNSKFQKTSTSCIAASGLQLHCAALQVCGFGNIVSFMTTTVVEFNFF